MILNRVPSTTVTVTNRVDSKSSQGKFSRLCYSATPLTLLFLFGDLDLVIGPEIELQSY